MSNLQILTKPSKNEILKTSSDEDILSAYIKRLNKYPVLSKKEEINIAKLAKKGDIKAKQKLVESNLKLVVNISKKLLHTSGMQIIDLIQEGNLGLIVAVEKFNPLLGYRFSTYATWWIKQAIFKAISEQSHAIKIPVYIQETLNKFSKIKSELEAKYNCQVRNEVVAKKMNIDENKINLYLSAYINTVSINDKYDYNENSNSTLSDILSDNNNNTIQYALDEELREDLNIVISKLKKKEQDILMFRFGINDFATKTLEEIGKIYGVTKECIRQIEKRALKKIREDKASIYLLESYIS